MHQPAAEPELSGLARVSLGNWFPRQLRDSWRRLPSNRRLQCRPFPSLVGVALRIVVAGEWAMGVHLRVRFDGYASGARLGRHDIGVRHAGIDHPGLASAAKIRGVLGKRGERRWVGLPLPRS